MAVYVDDQVVDLPGNDLSELLASAASRLDDSGRVVAEVQLDGQVLAGGDLDEHQQDVIDGGEWRLYTADPRDLTRATLEMMLVQLDKANHHQADAADKLTRDDQVKAMNSIDQALEVWQQTQTAVHQSVTLLNIDLSKVELGDHTASDVVIDLAEKLRAFIETLREGDSVALADALAYEWPQSIERWQGMLAAIIEQIDGMEQNGCNTSP